MATQLNSNGAASAVPHFAGNVVSIATPERCLRSRLQSLLSVRMADQWMDDVAKANIRGELDDATALDFQRRGWIERQRLSIEEVA